MSNVPDSTDTIIEAGKAQMTLVAAFANVAAAITALEAVAAAIARALDATAATDATVPR